MALQGTLDTFALPDVLRLLAATKKTGRLRITGGRGTGHVWVASGEVAAIDATHAPHATAAVDALFELLRFEEGAFTFEADVVHDGSDAPADVDVLLVDAEALLSEWREIESVVPSLDAWVTLRRTLTEAQVTIEQDHWSTMVAIGGGTTVRRLGDELSLSELPVSRAVKGLLELGVIDLTATAPVGTISGSAPLTAAPLASRPLLASDPDPAPAVPAGPRARRARAVAATVPTEPERFVPIDMPGHLAPTASYDDAPEVPVDVPADELAAAFPGLAHRSAATEADALDDEEIARQLATLSPRAADAVRAAAEAATDEERDAALAEVDDDGEPLNRGLLLKFLSSVKS